MENVPGSLRRGHSFAQRERRSLAHVAWALWLAVPVAGTAVVAIWTWWRGRPMRVATSAETIAAHLAYLAALTPPDLTAPDVTAAEPLLPDPIRSP
jgi:hypothetical protein